MSIVLWLLIGLLGLVLISAAVMVVVVAMNFWKNRQTDRQPVA